MKIPCQSRFWDENPVPIPVSRQVEFKVILPLFLSFFPMRTTKKGAFYFQRPWERRISSITDLEASVSPVSVRKRIISFFIFFIMS